MTTHATPFASVVETDRVFGVQFHPEKSGDAGVRMLRNFVHAMLSKRLIACLDVRNGCVVKGVQFEGLRNAGDPAALARRYNVEGIDELVILDVTATLEVAPGAGRDDSRRLARAVHPAGGRRRDPIAGRCRGGDRRGRGQGQRQQCGAASIPSSSPRLAARYGSQAIVVAIDAKRADGRLRRLLAKRQHRRPRAKRSSGRSEAESRGAGEILLTSIDRDGTREGFDCELTAAVSDAVSIPVIASGGAGTFEHFLDVFTSGHADAALAARLSLLRARGLGAEAVPAPSSGHSRSDPQQRPETMLIPSIDLRAAASSSSFRANASPSRATAIDEWIDRFSGWPKVQLIDLDAAKEQGRTTTLVARICAGFPAASAAGSDRSSARSSVLARSAPRMPSSARRSSRAVTMDTAFAQRSGRARRARTPDRRRGQQRRAASSSTAGAQRCRSPRSMRCASWSRSSAGSSTPTSTGRAAAGHGHAGDPAVRAATTRERHRRGRHHDAWRRSMSSIASASTRSSAWRSIPDGCRYLERA